MAISKISNSGIKTGVLKYDSMLAGNTAYDPAATWLIQRIAGTGSANTITFSNIPQTYQHLQIRYLARSTWADTGSYTVYARFNSDSGSNYARHRLLGDGSAVYAFGAASATYIELHGALGNNETSGNMSSCIIDIHDYASTSRNKTARLFGGDDRNGLGQVALRSGLWMSTNAITSITLTLADGNFTTSSTFALYGFIGA